MEPRSSDTFLPWGRIQSRRSPFLATIRYSCSISSWGTGSRPFPASPTRRLEVKVARKKNLLSLLCLFHFRYVLCMGLYPTYSREVTNLLGGGSSIYLLNKRPSNKSCYVFASKCFQIQIFPFYDSHMFFPDQERISIWFLLILLHVYYSMWM